MVLDTKWKRLSEKAKNYGISQSDMYQMYAYSKKYQTPDIWLLYPLDSEMWEHEPIEFRSDDGVRVRVRFVDVANIEYSLEDITEELKVQHEIC